MKLAPFARRRSTLTAVALGTALVWSFAPATAKADEPAPAGPAPVAPAPLDAAAPAPVAPAPLDPAAPVAPAAPEEAPHATKPRTWMLVTGAVALGGAYAFNLLSAPLVAIDPPDGAGAGGNPLLMVVPIIGPFMMGAQTTNNNLGFRRVEYIDGAFQAVGAVMIAASLIFPEEKTQVKAATATIQPVVSPRFVGMGGTF